MADTDSLDLDALQKLRDDVSLRLAIGFTHGRLPELLRRTSALISYARSLESQSALTDEQVDLISDALTGLWNRAPQRRAAIERLCISQGWLIEGEGPDD